MGAQGIVAEGGAHHVLIQNNTISTQTINFYTANGSRLVESNLTFRRNLFTHPLWMRIGSQAYLDKFPVR